MRAEDLLKYGIPVVIVAAIMYLFATRQQAPAAAGAPSAVTPVASGVEGQLIRMAQTQGAPDYIVRSLTPTDLGLASWSVTAGGAGWTNMVNTTVADQRWIAITGVSYYEATPLATQIRIQAGASMREYWPLTFIAGLQSHMWTDDTPPIAQQNQPVIIDVNFTGAATETISLMGIVVEKRGMTVA